MTKTVRAAESTDDRAPGPGPSPAAIVGSRLVIPMTADGKVDWSRVRGKKKDEIRKTIAALRRDTTRERTAAAAADDDEPAAAPPPGAVDLFSKQLPAMLLDVVGQLETLLAQRLYGLTADQARTFLYSESEKLMLADPMARILAKYGGAWLTLYADEMALASLLLMIHATKVQQLTVAIAATARPRDQATPLQRSYPRAAAPPIAAPGDAAPAPTLP